MRSRLASGDGKRIRRKVTGRTKQEVRDKFKGDLWQDHGLVLASSIGTPLDAANVRREFRRISAATGLGAGWAPRDLRHTFVSLMSADGVPIEEIARDHPVHRAAAAPVRDA